MSDFTTWATDAVGEILQMNFNPGILTAVKQTMTPWVLSKSGTQFNAFEALDGFSLGDIKTSVSSPLLSLKTNMLKSQINTKLYGVIGKCQLDLLEPDRKGAVKQRARPQEHYKHMVLDWYDLSSIAQAEEMYRESQGQGWDCILWLDLQENRDKIKQQESPNK